MTRHVIAVANQKGGVGKTTTAVNLAVGLARAGRRVIAVDLDPQGNTSTSLGAAIGGQRGSFDLLIGSPSELTVTTIEANLRLVRADAQLAGAEVELATQTDRAHLLRRGLKGAGYLSDNTEFILIDCPPSLGLLTINALVAATSVVIPVQCEFFALDGLARFSKTIESIQTSINPALSILGILLTMYDRRNNLSELVAADVRSFFRSSVLSTVIPRSIKLSEAPSHGLPIVHYDSRSAGAVAYERLAREILLRLPAEASVYA